MFVTKGENLEYFDIDSNGLTKGDKIELKGEVVVFIDKYIKDNGYHYYNYFKEDELVNGIVTKIHNVAYTSHPKPSTINIIEKKAYNISDRKWNYFNLDDVVEIKCILMALKIEN